MAALTVDWSKSYESLMRELGEEPYRCGCGRVFRSQWPMIFHMGSVCRESPLRR